MLSKSDQSDIKWTGYVRKQCSPAAPIRACSDRMRVGAVSQHGGNMIHQYKNNGYNIVLDVNSGSVHIVDDVVYDTLAQMDESDEHKYGEESFRRIDLC